MMQRLAAAALLAGGFALTFALAPWQDELVSDIPLYRTYADLFLDGELPYSDIGFEYPLLAAPVIALPGLVSLDLNTYRLVFAALAFTLALALLLSTERLAALTRGDQRRALIALASLPVLTGALIRTHFDLAPVVCLVAGIVAVVGTRPRVGFVLLGVGGALKAFPLLAVPMAVAWLIGRGRGREALVGAALASVTVAVAIGGAVALSPDGAWEAVDYHLERPVQIESIPATVLNAIEALGGRAPESVNSHKSDGLEHPGAGAIETACSVLLLGLLALLTLVAHRVADPRALALSALGAVAAFATLGKVLSPQFMLWLGPLVALAWAWRMQALAACAATAIAATLLWFPEHYFDLVARENWAAVAVAFRNILLVATLALIARELLRMWRESPAAAESTPPAHPRPLRSAPR